MSAMPHRLFKKTAVIRDVQEHPNLQIVSSLLEKLQLIGKGKGTGDAELLDRKQNEN